MTDSRIASRVDALIERVFEVDSGAFHDEMARGDLERWDSLGHVILVEALREEFGCEIPPEEALDMETIADIKRIMGAMMDGKQ